MQILPPFASPVGRIGLSICFDVGSACRTLYLPVVGVISDGHVPYHSFAFPKLDYHSADRVLRL